MQGRLQKSHPFVLLIYFIAVIGLTMFQRHYIFVFISFSTGLITWITIKKGCWQREIKYYLLLLFIITLTNPLFVKEGVTILYENTYLVVTLEALLYGFVFGLLLVAIMLWFSIMKEYLQEDHIVYLFGSTMPILGVVISMVLRLTTKFTEQYRRIKEANQLVFQQSSIKNKVKQQLDIFIILITWAFESSIDMMDSMNARGYGNIHRSHFHLFIFTALDALYIIILLILSGICIYGFIQYYHGFYYYPIMQVVTITIKDIFFCSVYIGLFLIPMISMLGGRHDV